MFLSELEQWTSINFLSLSIPLVFEWGTTFPLSKHISQDKISPGMVMRPQTDPSEAFLRVQVGKAIHSPEITEYEDHIHPELLGNHSYQNWRIES